MGCKNILVIDDDEAVLETIGEILESRGYLAAFARDGDEAFRILQKGPDLPCLIILDMMMPGVNGWQFLERQRADSKFANVPVIICSAFAETAKSVHGATILEKPIELQSLVRVVQAFCA
jgi:twitching motility two-component system response regulator PilH